MSPETVLQVPAITSPAARSPDRTAPSIKPWELVAISVPRAVECIDGDALTFGRRQWTKPWAEGAKE